MIAEEQCETGERDPMSWPERLMGFCQAYGPPHCFMVPGRGSWEPERLRAYLFFHISQGTCVVQMSGRQVEGMLIGWGDWTHRIRARAAMREHPFEWQENRPDGDCIYLAECVARSYPDGAIARRTVARLVGQLSHRFPNWASVSWLAYRHGRLVRLDRMAEGLGIGRRGRSSASHRPYRRK